MEDWQERRLRDMIYDYTGKLTNPQIERAIYDLAQTINPPPIDRFEIERVLRDTRII